MAVRRGFERVEFTITIEDKKDLRDLADYNDMSIPEFVRTLVIERLKEEGYR